MMKSLRRALLTRISRLTIGISAGLVLAAFAAHVGTGQIARAQTPKLAAGGPSNSEGKTRNLLVPNFPDIAGELREEAAKLLERIYERQDQVAESAGVDTYEEIYVDLLRLRWLGDRLRSQGEQTGFDIINRTDALDKWVNTEIKAAAAKPDLKRDVIRRGRAATLERAHESADKKLSRRIDEMFEKKNYIDAFEAFNEVTAPVEAQGLWYEAVEGDKHSLLEKWQSTRKKYLFPAQRQAKELAAQSRLAVYTEFDIDPQSFIKQIAEAAETLKTAPQMQLSDGQMVSGPQALGHFLQVWIELQNKAVRANAYRQIARYSGDAKPPDDARPPKTDTKTYYAAMCQEIIAKLAGLIEADAARASGDEATGLYAAYLDELPALLSRCTSPTALATFDGALKKLVAKSPPLKDRVEVYHALTDDLLRWRRRAADAYVRSKAADFPAPPVPGTLLRLRDTVPDMIAEASTKYFDKDVAVKDFVAVDSGAANAKSKYAVSEMFDRLVFSTTIPHDQFAAVGAEFRAEAFAVAVPPPTLAMRLALYRLETGDFQTAGGTVNFVGMIGVPACYLSLQSDNRGLIRLGSLQVAEDNVQNIDVMYQFMLEPKWMTDIYWYAPLPAKKADGAP
jgi:putative ubiquitin-RnfH superfamily antitoxin RatB of RatAB toxin-antitoxin module